MENVFVRNVTVGQCREAVLRINLQYENREKCKRGFDPIVRNVHLKNVTCEKSKLGVLIIGLDVYKPDDDEREWLSGLFLEDVPEEEELDEIEASARFYWDTDGMHILSLFPQRIGGETRGVNMSFTLRNNLLISFREEDIGVVRLLRHYMRHDRVEIENAMDILLELQDLKVEYLSDLIEDGYTTLEETSEQVLNDDEIHAMLQELMSQEETNSQIRLALHDTRRALRFLRRLQSCGAKREAGKCTAKQLPLPGVLLICKVA
jgi:Mg2+ and Co2+ transporter CorA